MFRLNIYIYKVKWNVLVIIIITRRIALPIQSIFFSFLEVVSYYEFKLLTILTI